MDRTTAAAAATKKPHNSVGTDNDITMSNKTATCFMRTKRHKYKEFTFRVTGLGDLELRRLDCKKQINFSLRKVQATKELRHHALIGVGAGRSISGHCLCLTTSQTSHYSIYFLN